MWLLAVVVAVRWFGFPAIVAGRRFRFIAVVVAVRRFGFPAVM